MCFKIKDVIFEKNKFWIAFCENRWKSHHNQKRLLLIKKYSMTKVVSIIDDKYEKEHFKLCSFC